MARLAKGVRLRADGRFEGRCMVNGGSYTVYGKTAKEAAEKLDNLKYEIKHGMIIKAENVTVQSWFDSWMKTYKANTVKQSTYNRYQRSYDSYIAPKIGKQKIEDVQPQMIQHLVNDLYDQGYSKTTINIFFVILQGMFDQAVKNQMIMHNPTEAVTLPRFKRTKQEDRRVMSVQEQKIFLEYAACSTYYNFYVTSLQTGMRINELLALEWKDIDFAKKEIHVSGTLVYDRNKGNRVKDTPKTQSSDRMIPILPDVEKVLKDCRKQQLENRVALGKDYKVEQGLEDMVFTYPDGGVYWDTGIRVDLRKIVKQINADGIEFEAITPHTFRHTFATRCAEQGMPLQVLKTILGHSSLAMTSDLYSHVLPDTKAKEMRKIANLI